ncbi:FUSC family protein [Streptomyces sp. XM83C]|jgi:uncharacterized membrane protein YccC|uniref:FUSC family protein n=1 Tax=Streptomyces thermocoprophilus TaxID=78356 RepID=A0ABV5V8D5_9ACTN|nr:FUSC family protein [Streptomyces sp. XM83C]MCK1818722.1 FUSC family protein [Streptomyces sp. XM83C]
MPARRPSRLPLADALRLGRPPEIWFKPALSVVVSAGVPNLLLVALGRLDLAVYTMAGSLCALYAHNRPYAARARTLAGVVLGMTAGLAVSLVTASLTTDAAVLVAVGAALAAVQKALCDATRIGPPGHVILTFVSSAALFAPQRLDQVPAHLAPAVAAGVWAWAVCMAPGLLRPHGPERRATAQALTEAATHAEAYGAAATAGTPRTHDATHAPGAAAPHATRTADAGHAGRARAAAAVHAAWQALLATGARTTRTRHALGHLLVRAEVALAAPADTDPERLRAWARALRGTGPLPHVDDLPGEAAELHGTDIEQTLPVRPLHRRLATLAPVAARCFLGCALAGWASLALGFDRPYWALVTAASLYQANLTLTWSRSVQRVVGNLLGVLLFAAIVPLAHLHQALLVLFCLALSFGAEALIGRNYWLGSVCVTPMALLITEFGRFQDSGELITERVLDTLVGALLGFAAALAVTDRTAGARLESALTAAERTREHTVRLLAAPHTAPAALEHARRALAAALVELRGTADAAAGEWWQRALPLDRVVLAEQAGHRTLAETVRRQGLTPAPRTDTQAEDVRP